jgi:hypothetical protein
MSSIRENILDAIEAKLETVTGLGVFRSRVAAFQRGENPCVLLVWTQATPLSNNIQRITWSLNVRIVLSYRGDQPDKLADDMISDIHTAIMNDMSLGGNAIDVQPSTQSFSLQNADDNAAEITLSYDVIYQTNMKDLET